VTGLRPGLRSALAVLVIAGAVLVGAGEDARSQAPIPRALSGIVPAPPGPTPGEPGVSRCSGLSRYRHRLGDTGPEEPELAAGVACVVGDFDANGHLDFAIWGRLGPSRRGLRGTRTFTVLFFGAGALVRTEVIRQEDYDHAVLWPRGRGHRGACPVSPQARDGIMLPGEGGGTWLYAYDPAAGRLRGELVCDE
jgi:hypothetical protein